MDSTALRLTYDDQPTMWSHISDYYSFKREKWPAMRNRQKALFLEGKLTVSEYVEALNLEKNASWIWLSSRLEKISALPNPLQSVKAISRQKLSVAMHDIKATFAEIESYVTSIEATPIEECPGYVFNTRFGITQAERQSVIDNEDGFTREVNLWTEMSMLSQTVKGLLKENSENS